MPVIDNRRRRRRLQMRARQHGHQVNRDQRKQQQQQRGAQPHGPITMRAPADAAVTPWRYIISTVPGGSVKLPLVPARARK